MRFAPAGRNSSYSWPSLEHFEEPGRWPVDAFWNDGVWPAFVLIALIVGRAAVWRVRRD